MSDAYQRIIDTLSRSKRVLITTHVRPDGDALGTSAAMALAMRKAGAESEVLLLSHLPTKYAFIVVDTGIVHHDAEQEWLAPLGLSGFRCSLVADTGTWSQLA